MWYTKYFSWILGIVPVLSQGQINLIPDPSFEVFEFSNQLGSNWYLHESPHYIKSYLEDKTKIIHNNYFEKDCNQCKSIKKCHSGSRCVHIYNSACINDWSEFRSIIQGTLLGPIFKDSVYFFSMYVSNNNSSVYNTTIPLYFIEDSVFSNTFNIKMGNHQRFDLPIQQIGGWQRIDTAFKSKGDYNFFIIGEAESKSKKIRSEPYSESATCTFIDDLYLGNLKESRFSSPDSFPFVYEISYYYDIGKFQIRRSGIIDSFPFKVFSIDSVIIVSSSDKQGDFDYNMKLSSKRSTEVRQYIIHLFPFLEDSIIHIQNRGELDCPDHDNPLCRSSHIKFFGNGN